MKKRQLFNALNKLERQAIKTTNANKLNMNKSSEAKQWTQKWQLANQLQNVEQTIPRAFHYSIPPLI
ncbi:hypothetical protein [Thalassotalea piscium]|uniref:Uncharacterized protein n=1 Tax=Thalassotalea piscium TaxID=1230533 RepID=A0A7X0NGP4_9GAMM|nr:hypothetical protein [Thalassotalea piscium]MBB6543145.1 hypothetical protein [Thalassotalea piscium]